MKEKYIFLTLSLKGFHPYYINRFVLLFLKKVKSLFDFYIVEDCSNSLEKLNSVGNTEGSETKDFEFPRLHETSVVTQVFIPKKVERFTLLRSPHVDKKARDQFERVTHKRVLTIKVLLSKHTNLKLYRIFQNLNSLSLGVHVQIKYQNIC